MLGNEKGGGAPREEAQLITIVLRGEEGEALTHKDICFFIG